ncbi:MAG: nucleoside 2-deoxyribosyltransferase [Bryobacterales bacterium]|nr:nucleoside 2-deoxyribosyltransferase [Bryobacterales bacterium]
MSLTVVGGWYEEICAEPYWHEYYGPGGRAAIALAGRNAAIRLLTYCPIGLKPKLEYQSTTFGFEYEAFGTASAVTRFQYLHWLRPPVISPASISPSELPTICLDTAENVVRYGFYEGDAIVKAKRAVYDPQNALDKVRPFNENGSSAQELFIVCNFAEGAKLSGETSPDSILEILLKMPNTIAVALKSAWDGVYVATQSQSEIIKPTPTAYVHKIGSGDLFTAETAYGWMILGLDPITATRRASAQVAYYVNSASLPLPESAVPTPASAPRVAQPDDPNKQYDVYVAGPFFNYAQLSVVEEMGDLFRDAELRVFSPYHDVGLSQSVQVAKQDLEALRACRIVVACLEGCDPGTVFEVGYARALDIPVLLYAPNLTDLHATMFLGSGCELVRDFTTAIYRAIWWANAT